jgi:apolipoprotein N-acyltransferase
MLRLTPLAIAGFEWLHGQTDASYPWLSIGYALVQTPFAQIADVVGVYGLSFLLAVVNTAITVLLLHSKERSMLLQGSVSTLLVLVTWFAVGVMRSSYPTSHGELRAALIQPNENPWDKWSDPELQLWSHMRITDSVRSSQFAEPWSSTIDVVIWSETAIPFLIRDKRYEQEWTALRTWVDTSAVPLITGCADVVVYPAGSVPPSARRSATDPSVGYDAFNAALVMNPGQPHPSLHYKSMLTPFAERLPFADHLTFAMSWIEWGVGISAWGKGQTRNPLPVVRDRDTLARIGAIICIESIYPEVASDMVANGADVLCVITNDAWYNGTWGPPQHFDIARMRAIEQRRAVLRCAQSGVTGVILPDGTDAGASVPVMQRGALIASVPTYTGRTFYSRVGDPVPILGLLFTIFALVAARIPACVRVLSTRSSRLSTTEKSHL